MSARSCPIAEERAGFDGERFDLAYPPGIGRHYWTLARNRIVEREVRASGVRGGPILEIGCGRGIVVEHLRRAGHDCLGVDRATAEPLDSVRPWVRTGIDAAGLPPETARSVGLLLLLDVLEHLPDPPGFLRRMAAAFPGAAQAIVTVPAGAELWTNYDEFYGHLRRYDEASLRAEAAAAGAEVVALRPIFRPLYPAARLLPMLGLRRRTAIRAPGRAAAWLHRALAELLVLDRLLPPGGIRGTSLLCRLRMPGGPR